MRIDSVLERFARQLRVFYIGGSRISGRYGYITAVRLPGRLPKIIAVTALGLPFTRHGAGYILPETVTPEERVAIVSMLGLTQRYGGGDHAA
jgi:hypothetical protein